MRRQTGWVLAITILFVTGMIGVLNGVRELSDTLTPLQRSVSTGVLIYGLVGLCGGIALAKRHRSAVWLAGVWGVAVTYVSAVAAIAYAGADATLVAATASGIVAALIAAGVTRAAHVETRRGPVSEGSEGVRALTIVLVMLACSVSLGGCRQLYGGPPIVSDRANPDRLVTKVVRAKREPDRLVAQDLTVCWVAPDVFTSIRAGDHWRCDWRRVPEGQ